jgi:hypothetical protein
MGKLLSFSSLKDKQEHFSNKRFYEINTKTEFDEWFHYYTSEKSEGKRSDFIFRGMSDARFKLYTSAQREWIQNDMEEWANGKYLQFVDDMIQGAKKYPLIKKVFDVYGYSDTEREFPILSILQHYWAPTPLMDWTYNINVALFFATENLSSGNGNGDISNYFSIYRINKSKYRNELLNIRDILNDELPSFETFSDLGERPNEPNSNTIFYISDFDESNAYGTTPQSDIKILKGATATSIYNQNIIPQEGLFIFNPFSQKTIDEIFNVDLTQDGWNLALTPFSCFNIKKDLAEYVRRHIKQTFNIGKSFIYPTLYDDAKEIRNLVLNEYAKR